MTKDKSEAPELVVPFDAHTGRSSLFLPTYLSRLIMMTADREGLPKSSVVRNGLIRTLMAYIDEIGGTDQFAEQLQKPDCTDFEHDLELMEELYLAFAAQDEAFAPRMRLTNKRKLSRVEEIVERHQNGG